MNLITTHVLNTSLGVPAKEMPVSLEIQDKNQSWRELAKTETDSNGRVSEWPLSDSSLLPGIYRLKFDTGRYFQSINQVSFYPSISIVFKMTEQSHYHLPLLLSPYGYSTYRGSR